MGLLFIFCLIERSPQGCSLFGLLLFRADAALSVVGGLFVLAAKLARAGVYEKVFCQSARILGRRRGSGLANWLLKFGWMAQDGELNDWFKKLGWRRPGGGVVDEKVRQGLALYGEKAAPNAHPIQRDGATNRANWSLRIEMKQGNEVMNE